MSSKGKVQCIWIDQVAFTHWNLHDHPSINRLPGSVDHIHFVPSDSVSQYYLYTITVQSHYCLHTTTTHQASLSLRQSIHKQSLFYCSLNVRLFVCSITKWSLCSLLTITEPVFFGLFHCEAQRQPLWSRLLLSHTPQLLVRSITQWLWTDRWKVCSALIKM